jgi:hypothetical protein
MLALFDVTRSFSERLSAAKDGEIIDVPIDGSTLTELIASCRSWLEENDDFWRLSRHEQDQIIDCRAAAARLLEKLAAEPAEAVA